MTPERLAALHAACFVTPRPFTAQEFAALLSSDLTFLCPHPSGFALGRAVAGEAELITLAVDPMARRGGIGGQLLTAFETTARQRGAGRAFLEVAADNLAARALYSNADYTESGRRRGYYRTPGCQAIDAILMCKPLQGH